SEECQKCENLSPARKQRGVPVPKRQLAERREVEHRVWNSLCGQRLTPRFTPVSRDLKRFASKPASARWRAFDQGRPSPLEFSDQANRMPTDPELRSKPQLST